MEVERSRSLSPRLPIGTLPAILFLVVFFCAPLLVLAYYSLLSAEQGEGTDNAGLTTYVRLFSDSFTYYLFGRTILLSAAVTLLCLVFGYPVAFLYRQVRSRLARTVILGSVITPLLTSSLVLTFGWIVILGKHGLLNDFLVGAGLLKEPISILFTLQGVFIGMVQVHLPFMIVPLVAILQSVPRDLEDSAADLGATRWQIFWNVTIPQSVPGIAAGMSLVFVLSYTAFTIPTLMGGASLQIVSVYIWNNVRLLTWSTAAALALLLLVTSLIAVVSLNAVSRKVARWRYL